MSTEQAGWRPDPTGRHELRYWDGSTWTEHVSDRGAQSVDGDLTPAAPGVPAPPPAAAPAPRRRRNGCLIAAIIVAVLVVGAIVIFAVAANKAVDDLNAEQAKHAITKTEFDAVQLGITHAALQEQLGKTPEDSQEFVQKGVLDQADINSSCVYYNEAGETFGSRFQFCFEGDSLRTKNAY